MSKITVFTKNDCAQCTATKKMMAEKGIEFTEINVEEHEHVFDILKMANIYSMPAVVVDTFENGWTGFRPDRIEELAKNES